MSVCNCMNYMCAQEDRFDPYQLPYGTEGLLRRIIALEDRVAKFERLTGLENNQ